MTPKKKKIVVIVDEMCKTCDHEKTYHKGGGFLSRVKCLVTGCKCTRFIFGRKREIRSEVFE